MPADHTTAGVCTCSACYDLPEEFSPASNWLAPAQYDMDLDGYDYEG